MQLAGKVFCLLPHSMQGVAVPKICEKFIIAQLKKIMSGVILRPITQSITIVAIYSRVVQQYPASNARQTCVCHCPFGQ